MLKGDVVETMKSRLPVEYNGIRYRYISEYVLKFNPEGKQILSVGLLDNNGKCMVYAPLEQVHLAQPAAAT